MAPQIFLAMFNIVYEKYEWYKCCKKFALRLCSCPHFVLTWKFDCSAWYNIKTVVRYGPHSKIWRNPREVMGSQKRTACRQYRYWCVNYLLRHSQSPSVMRGYRLHKPDTALPHHHRLTTGLTLSLILYVVYFSRRINWSGRILIRTNFKMATNVTVIHFSLFFGQRT
jgi:hypothetical protein